MNERVQTNQNDGVLREGAARVNVGAGADVAASGTKTDFVFSFGRDDVRDMQREGNDLVLVLDNGETVRIKDFYLAPDQYSLIYDAAGESSGLGGLGLLGLLGGIGGLAAAGLAVSSSSNGDGGSIDVSALDTTPPSLNVFINPIARNDIVNRAEADADIEISGMVSGEFRSGDIVTVLVGNTSFETTVNAAGRYSVFVPGELIGQNGVVSVSIRSTDASGNTGVGTASRDYTVEGDAPNGQIILDPIASDGVVNAAEAAAPVTLSGEVVGAAAGDAVTLLIGDESFTAIVKSDGSFSVSVPGSLLAANDTVLATVTLTDSGGNTAVISAERPYSVDLTAPVLNVTVSASQVSQADADGLVPVSGSVSGARTGDTVTVTVNGKNFTTQVQAGGSFELSVPGADLLADADGIVHAVVSSRDAAGNPATGSAEAFIVTFDVAPVASSTVIGTTEDTELSGSLPTAIDAEGGPVVYALGTAPSHGGVVIGEDGTYIYNPAPDFHGEDRFTYTVTDRSGQSNTYTVRVSVLPANDAPVIDAGASTIAGGIAEDAVAPITGTIVASDVDVGDVLRFAAGGSSVYGSFQVDAATGVWSYLLDNAKPQVQALRAGQVVTETFTVEVSDGHGGTDVQAVTITITGTNDAPLAVGTQTGLVSEDGAGASGTATGQVTFTDVDAGDSHSFAAGAGTYGQLVVNASGIWTYTLDNANGAVQALGAGAVLTDTIPVTVTDGSGATAVQNVVITINGTNDAPVAVDAAASAVEDGAVLGGTLMALDVDTAAVDLVFSTAATVQGFVLDGATGAWTFDPADAAYDRLAAGEQQVIVVPFTVSDDHGATDTGVLTITVTGTNDTPYAVADVAGVHEDVVVTGSVAVNDGDVDHGAVLSYGLVTPVAGLVFNSDGSWSFDASQAAYQPLAAGVTRDVVIDYTVTDEHGASAASTLTITVTGTNDAPVAVDAAVTAVEDGAVLGGTLVALDVDTAAVDLVFSTAATVQGFVLDGATGAWTFDPADAAYDRLAAGEQQVIVIPFTVSDDHGATDTGVLTITVTGTNDTPYAVADMAGVHEDAVVTGSVAVNDGDVDHGAVLSYGLVTPVAGLVFNSDGSWSFDASQAAYQPLAAGVTRDVVINYTVTDEHGASAASTLTITVTGTNDAPVIDAGASTIAGGIAEDAVAPITGTIVASDVDVGDVLQFAVGGSSVYGSFQVDAATGVWTYLLDNAKPQVQALRAGQVVTETFTVAVSDGHGGTEDQRCKRVRCLTWVSQVDAAVRAACLLRNANV